MSAAPADMPAVLFVCMGNICRSPAAEGVLRARRAHLGADARTDSAGTGDWHAGESPDERMTRAAAARGYDLSHMRARTVCASDFCDFDVILAMDRHNLDALRRLAPPGARAKVSLLLDHAPRAPRPDVPDPYYGGTRGFEDVLDLIEQGVDGFLASLAHPADSPAPPRKGRRP